MKCMMGCLRQREIFWIIANSSLLLLGHTYFKSESRLRSWQRSWPCWNQWLFYSGIRLGQAFISCIFPWTCLFFYTLPPKCGVSVSTFFFPLWSSEHSLKGYFFVEQFTINLLLSRKKCGEISLPSWASKVALQWVSIIMFFWILLLSS